MTRKEEGGRSGCDGEGRANDVGAVHIEIPVASAGMTDLGRWCAGSGAWVWRKWGRV